MDRPAPTSVMLSPVLLATLGVIVVIACRGVVSAHRRGERLNRWRTASLLTALLLLVLAVASPLATLAAHYLLSAHLIQVTLVMGVVPPLLLLGLPLRRSTTVPRWLRIAGGVVVHPATAIVLVNVVFFGWHATALYQACLEHEELYATQLLSLLLVSLAFWWPIVEPLGPSRWSMGALYKLGYILLATIPQTFAGLVFALAHHPFYAGYATAPVQLGIGSLVDQQIAGACMALLSKVALFAAFSVVLWRLFDEQEAGGETGDDGGGGQDDDAPTPVRPPTPAWLLLLERGPLSDEPAPVRSRDAVGSRD